MGEATYDFSGRRALVTGGTRGLGLAIAHSLADAGAKVSVTGTKYLTSLYDADLSRFDYLQLQLTDRDSITEVAESAGAVDTLVHCAGARMPSSADPHERDFVIQAARLGLLGPAQLTTRLRFRLGESRVRGGGSVVHTNATRRWFDLTHGTAAGHDEMAAHTARLGSGWARHGVRVNAIASSVSVPRQSQLRVQIDRSSGPLLTRTRTPRNGTQQDVAAVVMFLASSGAAFVTGQTLTVAGGAHEVARTH